MEGELMEIPTVSKADFESEDAKTEVSIVSMEIEPSMSENLDEGKLVASRDDMAMEPYEGMEFGSEEAARAFYTEYARRTGFRIRISRYTRSRRDNSIISRRIVCSKEGFREVRGNEGLFSEQRQRQRAVTRIGCKAMIKVKKFGPSKWIVTKFVKEHNHGAVPPRKNEVRSIHQDYNLKDKSCTINGDMVREPFVGMEFESEETAKLFYINYASQKGFRARISKYCRSRRDNSIISRQIVCSKEGFREVRVKREIIDEGKSKRPRVITRIGCKAMIIVKKSNSGKWVVTKFEKEHNHALLTSKEVPFFQSDIGSGELVNSPGWSVVPTEVKVEGCCAGTQGNPRESLTVLYNQLCYEAIKYAQEGSVTEEIYNVAISALREAVEKVSAAKRGMTVTQPGSKQAFIVAQGSNISTLPQVKDLHDLQCSDEVKQATTAQQIKLLQQPVGLVLVPSNVLTDLSSSNSSAKVPVTLNIPTNGTCRAHASQRIDHTSFATEIIMNTQSTVRQAEDGPEGSDLNEENKKEMQSMDRDVEINGPFLNSQSEAHLLASPALPVALYMPVTGSLPAACSVATPGMPGGSYAFMASPIEALPLSARPAGSSFLSQNTLLQTTGSSLQSGSMALVPSLGTPSDQCKQQVGPNPRVHATAIACGARVVSPKAAAPLIKAIEAKIKFGGATIARTALPTDSKPLAAEVASMPSPNIEEDQKEIALLTAIPNGQCPSSEETRLHEPAEASKQIEVGIASSLNGDAGERKSLFERQMDLLESGESSEDLAMFEKRTWAEVKL
ncbi:uncharacterized protein [Typha angustifolia]|uniref:uncharacterized protein isoform X2 n=1 Tax=Typha angustifolia TaxID=59011 RepID=UPI003C2DE3F4